MVVQSKDWLFIGRMDALHRLNKTHMFQGAWRGLEPEATLSHLDFILSSKTNEGQASCHKGQIIQFLWFNYYDFYFSAVPTATSAVVVTLIGTQNLNSGFGKLCSSKPGFEID